MIQVMKHLWKDKATLNDILSSSPESVLITDAKVVATGKAWEGYASDIKYGYPVVTKHNKVPYSFRKETNGTVRVF